MKNLVPTRLIDSAKAQIDSLPRNAIGSDKLTTDIRHGIVFQIFDLPCRDGSLVSLHNFTVVRSTAAQLLGDAAAVGWSLLLNKVNDAHSNWHIPWHQDTSVYCAQAPEEGQVEIRGGFKTFRPQDNLMTKLVVARIPLDEDSVQSGCLYVIPESHKLGNLWPDGGGIFEGNPGEPLEVRVGDVLFFNPLLMHRAEPNHTVAQRRVIHTYYRPVSLPLPGGATWIDWAQHRR